MKKKDEVGKNYERCVVGRIDDSLQISGINILLKSVKMNWKSE